MRQLPVSVLIGLALLVAAATASVGWFTHAPALVRFMTGAAMVFNTALCFGLVALAFLIEGCGGARRRSIQTLLGAAIMLLGSLVLAEHVFGVKPGIDWPSLHAWYRDDNPHPGRMSPPTALGFILTGAVLFLMHRVRRLWSGLLVQALTAAVIVIGAVGIVNYLLKLPLVFDSYPFRQMALATAMAFILTGTALWSCWRRHHWYVTRELVEMEARRIGLNSVVVLASIVCVSMLAGLVVVQRQFEILAKDSLLSALESRINLVKLNIDLRSTRADVVATRPDLAGFMRLLNERPADEGAHGRLRVSAETFLPLGFTGLAFLTTGSREQLRVGRFAEGGVVAIALRTAPYENTLMWSDDSFVLQTRIPMFSGGEPAGFLLSEQRLTALGAAMDRADDFAATAEAGLCGRQGERLACFPRRFAPEPFTIAYDAALPVARALAGETGVTITRDTNLNNVIAAYGPVGSLGLGMVIELRTAELYAPLREALTFILMLGLFLVAGGALLFYWRVTPLVRKLHVGEQRLRLALDSSRSAWWDWDVSSGKIELSEQWRALLGGPAGSTVTTLEELRALVHPDDLPGLERKLRVALRSRDGRYDVEHRVRRHDGGWMWISSVGRVVEHDASERAVRMIGINSDISQRKEFALRMEYQARHDMLTGLPNRATFHDRLEQAMSRGRRTRKLLAVMYLDIDRFKSVNDRLGHSVGDLLLKDFGQRLAYCVRAVDTVARMGGDEFAVILEELGQREDGCRIAEKIVREMQPEFPLDHHTVAITTSVGIAFWDGKDALSPDTLVRNADGALYEAKNAGRNNYQVAD
jgi:diguanylate cyclase (GGDEF)-like protein/PAS domain S-box-containing protein